MDKKTGYLTVEERILLARKENLEQIRSTGSLQPLGKILGMDTFLWQHPEPKMLAEWVLSLPFQLIWIGGKDTIERTFKKNGAVAEKVESLVAIEGHNMDLHTNVISAVSNILTTESIENALEFIRPFRSEKRILLISVNENEFDITRDYLKDLIGKN